MLSDWFNGETQYFKRIIPLQSSTNPVFFPNATPEHDWSKQRTGKDEKEEGETDEQNTGGRNRQKDGLAESLLHP